jgi:hypothetical protein
MRGSTLHVRVLLALLVASLSVAACDSDTSSDPTAAPSDDATTTTDPPGLQLVAIGDSIAFNASYDCLDCTGFVDRYANAVGEATGQPVDAANYSQHTGLTLPDLMDQLDGYTDDLAGADIILVGIAHNSSELATQEPCGAPMGGNGLPDWSEVDQPQACAAASAEEYRPQFEALFSQIAALRDGKPTILRTINRYNDWIGWDEANLTPDEERTTKIVLDGWDEMLCAAAEQNGFGCADIYRAFNGLDGLEPSGDLLADDHTHPSDAGNEVIAGVLTDLGYAPLA